jgi:pimeloyl-ACP methyl ester carboxylesterase
VAARKAELPDQAGGSNGPEPAPESVEGRVAWFRSQDGLALAVRFFDDADSTRLPLLCLPGLSRNSRDFIALGQFFSRHQGEPRQVIAVDYRGRGLSDDDPTWSNYRPITEAQDVLAATAAFGIERAILVGTSRGGILAMLLGALCPALIAGVVLNDIGPVIESRGLARIKGYLGVKKRTLATWDAAVAEVRAAGEVQYPGLLEEDWRALAAAYYGETENGFAPLYDPDLRKAMVDVDRATKIPQLWPQFMSLARVPVFAIRGALSDVLSAQTLAEMVERHPRLESLTVERQGHAPLLRDAATLERIRAFAARCDAEAAVFPKRAVRSA